MNTVCHIEFDVVDLDRAQAFYEPLFGWSFREFMGGQMRVFGVGETHVGGLMLKDQVVPGRSPSVWIQVPDLDGVVARAPELGGSVQEPKYPVLGVGHSALIADPDGNPVGLVEYE
jgi:predicted enzyme related to lactoylglutathione lyase